jgi:hypothetical protein
MWKWYEILENLEGALWRRSTIDERRRRLHEIPELRHRGSNRPDNVKRERGSVSPREFDRAPLIFVKGSSQVMHSPLAALRHRGAVSTLSCEITDVHLGDRYAKVLGDLRHLAWEWHSSRAPTHDLWAQGFWHAPLPFRTAQTITKMGHGSP